MSKKLIAFASTVILLLSGCAAKTSQTSDFIFEINISNPDYLLLSNAEFFACDGVGYGTDIPAEIFALRRLVWLKNGRDYCIMLEKYGNNQGKLYALCGLYYLDYPYYTQLMEKYVQNSEEVVSWVGCVVMTYTVKDIVLYQMQPYDDGAVLVRLANNTESLDNWLAKNDTPNGFIVDFYGGGIPAHVGEKYLF